ncbi:premelanosome protein a [Platichthys flesus]|uniref:premelanosome protein a n=1 Tax=Platichthys flesus TaxID=8260 RepID=UPI002DBFAB68|nr:premelanosome protein a [Platichthys flesus]
MTTVALLLLIIAFTSANAIQLVIFLAERRSQFTRYRSWNSRMYPVWKDGDTRFRNCWFGGEVTFDLKSDGPTLTGARTTFNINLNFPPNQTALSDGQVVWARNCTIDGQQYQEGQAVYPNQDTEQTGLFPDGTPFNRSQNKKPHYVFVWKTWGRYWQVADGPSSSLTIGTDNVPLGSYNMEVVIYHCRGKDKFIPLGYASSVFSVTDQVPFSISLAQLSDLNQDDQNFIQNRAIAFSVKLHDPSQYLGNADISFSWDFGDSSGTLISREQTVTHTYLAVGAFKPQVVLMATIPGDCGNPTASPAVIVIDPTQAAPAEAGDAIALDVPAPDATPLAASVQPADTAADTVDGDAVVDTDAEVIEVASVAPAGVDAAVVPAEDPANAAAEVDAAADETDATTGEAATVAPVAPAAEEPAVADTAAVDTNADETAVVDTEVADAAVVDADTVVVDTAVVDADTVVVDTAVVDADTVVVDTAVVDADTAVADAAVVDADTVVVDADTVVVDTAAADTVVVDADTAVADEAAADTDAATAVTEENVIDAAASVAPVAEGEETAVEDTAGVTVAPVAEEAVEQEAEAVATDADAAAEVVQAETAAPADDAVAPVATEATVVEEAAPVDAAVDTEAEVQETENEVVATVAAAEIAAVEEEAAPAEAEADPAQVVLVVAKRQAPELAADCMVYRYGSLATSVDVVQGIESVEIVQVSNVVSMTTEVVQNAVDVTISCQGSLPSEVCTVISDADCITPVQTICTAATPSPDCQMILRQFFNDSGVFCINVSLTNDVSLAVASARVSVTVASGGSPAGTAATVLGVMVLACVVCCIGLMYRRFKQYQPLSEDQSGGSATVTSVPLLLWNLLSRQSPGESRPLLQGRMV